MAFWKRTDSKTCNFLDDFTHLHASFENTTSLQKQFEV